MFIDNQMLTTAINMANNEACAGSTLRNAQERKKLKGSHTENWCLRVGI